MPSSGSDDTGCGWSDDVVQPNDGGLGLAVRQPRLDECWQGCCGVQCDPVPNQKPLHSVGRERFGHLAGAVLDAVRNHRRLLTVGFQGSLIVTSRPLVPALVRVRDLAFKAVGDAHYAVGIEYPLDFSEGLE